MTVHKITPAAKRDLRRLEGVQKLFGKAAFLLGEAGAMNAMVELAKAAKEVEHRIDRIIGTCG